MKRVFLGIFLICFGVFYAQQGNVTGRVVDDLRLPLAGADVSIQNTETFTITNNNGFYSINKLAPGTYDLEVNFFGYHTKIVSFEITANQTTEVNIQLDKGVDLAEIQVVGSLTGTAKALNQQRNMVNVGNVISAEQVDQFPDDNMGDALKRVPGINVQYDQGEARFGNIRGTAPDLSAVTMNGNRLPSAEGETRAFQLDLIPADLVQAIEVNKVVTPDMDGDAIGASVNLVTRSVPDARRVRVDLSGGYNTIADKTNYKGALLYADRIANDKLGFTFTGSVFNNFIGSENYEAEWKDDGGINDEAFAEDVQLRKYDVQRLRQNYTAAFDYKFNQNHRIELGAGYNQRDDYENRFRYRFKDIEWDEDENSYMAEIQRETKGGTNKDARLERQKLINFNINGEHDFAFMEMDWGFISSKASEERPNERYIVMRNKNVLINPDFSDMKLVDVYAVDAAESDIQNFSIKEITEEFQFTEEKDNTFFVNLDFPLKKGKYENHIKVGGKFKFKDKVRDNQFYEFEALDEDALLTNALSNVVDHSDSDFQASDMPIGSFVTEGFLGGLDLNNTALFENLGLNLEEIAGNYTASEDVKAGYVRFDQKIGKEWHFVGGLRVEQTSVKYNGFITDLGNEDEGIDPSVTATGEKTKDYTNLMPSLLIKYSPTKWWNVKFGITNTIARPRYFDLVPYQIIVPEDNEIQEGNPTLEATNSLNLDLMFEKYFKNIGLIEAGIFYKDITDFIVNESYTDYSIYGNTWDRYTRPINAGDADLFGFEFGFQRPLDFISSSLKAFSIYTNYTFTKSKVKNFNIEGRENEDLGLTGTPEHTINASLAYNTPKVEARVSYNYASDFVEEFGESAFYDRYYDAVDYLDFNFGYNFSKRFNAYLKINNILNQPLRYFQGTQDRTMQAEYYGVKYKLGVQINL